MPARGFLSKLDLTRFSQCCEIWAHNLQKWRTCQYNQNKKRVRADVECVRGQLWNVVLMECEVVRHTVPRVEKSMTRISCSREEPLSECSRILKVAAEEDVVSAPKVCAFVPFGCLYKDTQGCSSMGNPQLLLFPLRQPLVVALRQPESVVSQSTDSCSPIETWSLCVQCTKAVE